MFSDRDSGRSFRGIVQDIELGSVNSVAFVVPDWPAWPLPLYELALMTAERASSMRLDAQITFITPEGRPLKAFGQAAGEAIARLLAQAGIKLHTGVVARNDPARRATVPWNELDTARAPVARLPISP